MPRRPLPLRALALGLPLLLAFAAGAHASPRERRRDACDAAHSPGERYALGCWRLRTEAGRGFGVHGGAPVARSHAAPPAEREAASSKRLQRRRDWLRAREAAVGTP
jgi:hypothetical protein